MAAAHEFQSIEVGDLLTLYFDLFELTGTFKGIEGSQILLEVRANRGRGSTNLQKKELASVQAWARTEDLIHQMLLSNAPIVLSSAAFKH